MRYIIGFLSLLLTSLAYAIGPIEIVVSAAPGGPLDVVSRAVATYFVKEGVKDTIVISKPGGDAIIAVQYALDRKNDIILGANAGPFVFNPIIKKKLPYNANKDFDFVVPMVMVPSSLIVSNQSKIQNFTDFINEAKKRPLNCGVNNQGTAMALALLLNKLGIDNNVAIIMYKGTSPTKLAMLSGELDCAMDPVSSYAQEHNLQKVNIIGVSGDQPYEEVKAVPLISKYVPGYHYVSWFGMALPKTMSAESREYYKVLLNRIGTDLEYNKTISASGMVVVKPSTDPAKWLENEQQKWEDVRRRFNIEKID